MPWNQRRKTGEFEAADFRSPNYVAGLPLGFWSNGRAHTARTALTFAAAGHASALAAPSMLLHTCVLMPSLRRTTYPRSQCGTRPTRCKSHLPTVYSADGQRTPVRCYQVRGSHQFFAFGRRWSTGEPRQMSILEILGDGDVHHLSELAVIRRRNQLPLPRVNIVSGDCRG